MRHQRTHAFPIASKGRDECRERNDSRLDEQLRHLSDPADILDTTGVRKTEIDTQPMSDIIPIQNEGAAPQPMQMFFDRMG